MQEAHIQAEGRLLVGSSAIPVYRLDTCQLTVDQNAAYEYLTGKSAKGNIRNNLKNSALNKYLPAKMLEAAETFAYQYDTKVRLMMANEWVWLCSAIVELSFHGPLNKSWSPALPKAQRLLMMFAEEGISACLERSIIQNPLMTAADFDLKLEMILDSIDR